MEINEYSVLDMIIYLYDTNQWNNYWIYASIVIRDVPASRLFTQPLFRRWSKEHQSSASLVVVRGIHQWPVNYPHKWPVTRNMFPFDDVIIWSEEVEEILTKVVFYSINKSSISDAEA